MPQSQTSSLGLRRRINQSTEICFKKDLDRKEDQIILVIIMDGHSRQHSLYILLSSF